MTTYSTAVVKRPQRNTTMNVDGIRYTREVNHISNQPMFKLKLDDCGSTLGQPDSAECKCSVVPGGSRPAWDGFSEMCEAHWFEAGAIHSRDDCQVNSEKYGLWWWATLEYIRDREERRDGW